MPPRLNDTEQTRDFRQYLQVELQPKPDIDTETINPGDNYSKCFDDDARLKRTGTLWTATSHIITAVIGSGVLSLAWAVAQLGWVAGPIVLLLFAFVTVYTSSLLCQCYRAGDRVSGQRSCTCMDAVKTILGGRKVSVCGVIQYLNLLGVAIGYTIAASVSMMAIKRSNCFHKSGEKDPCHMSSNGYMITFGMIEIIFPQIPDFDQVWWLSIVAAIMSFTYSLVGLSLGIAKVAENGIFKGSLTGIRIGLETEDGTITSTQKLWRSLQALGAIAFAYSFSVILIEIQVTIQLVFEDLAEYKTMKKATVYSIFMTTAFYLLCGCMGYAAFGDLAPGNLLTGFGFYNPYWLLDIANLAIVIHLVGAYQVISFSLSSLTSLVLCKIDTVSDPCLLFAFVENNCAQRWPNNEFITEEYHIPIPFRGNVYRLNLFRRNTIFVIFTTAAAMLLPFFNDVVGLLGAFGFWPLTVYFPVEMYIKQKKIGRWTTRWLGLQILSCACLLISVVAAIASMAGVVLDLNTYKPFKTSYSCKKWRSYYTHKKWGFVRYLSSVVAWLYIWLLLIKSLESKSIKELLI